MAFSASDLVVRARTLNKVKEEDQKITPFFCEPMDEILDHTFPLVPESLYNDLLPCSLDWEIENESERILPGCVYLSGIGGVCHHDPLTVRNIGLILTIASDVEIRQFDGFVYHRIPVVDDEEEDLLSHFPHCVSMIDHTRRSGKSVLVHCRAGISRSASIVASYIIACNQIPRIQALEMIRQARKGIRPNDGFMKQLDEWECIVLNHLQKS